MSDGSAKTTAEADATDTEETESTVASAVYGRKYKETADSSRELPLLPRSKAAHVTVPDPDEGVLTPIDIAVSPVVE